MNIQLLLSANPSQGSGTSASQATEAQGFPTGLFRQAMLQAQTPNAQWAHFLTLHPPVENRRCVILPRS